LVFLFEVEREGAQEKTGKHYDVQVNQVCCGELTVAIAQVYECTRVTGDMI
jgi:hypothetical protein